MNNRRKLIKPMAEINVVPYIDVMLVLLVIFMVTAPMLFYGIEVEVPVVDNRTTAAANEPLVVSVNAQVQYFLNVAIRPEVPLELKTLVERIKIEVTKNPQRRVLIKGDRRINYEKIINLMNELQKIGIYNLGLITTPDAK